MSCLAKVGPFPSLPPRHKSHIHLLLCHPLMLLLCAPCFPMWWGVPEGSLLLLFPGEFTWRLSLPVVRKEGSPAVECDHMRWASTESGRSSRPVLSAQIGSGSPGSQAVGPSPAAPT